MSNIWILPLLIAAVLIVAMVVAWHLSRGLREKWSDESRKYRDECVEHAISRGVTACLSEQAGFTDRTSSDRVYVLDMAIRHFISQENFVKWYDDLRIYMASLTDNDGVILNPDDWAGKDEWRVHFDGGLSYYCAYLEEC